MDIMLSAPVQVWGAKKAAGKKAVDAAVVFASENSQLSASARALDAQLGGFIRNAMEARQFQGKAKEILALAAPVDASVRHIILIGTGNGKKINAVAIEGLGAAAVTALNGVKAKNAAVYADGDKGWKMKPAEVAAHLALGARLKAYRFDKYRTKEKPESKPTLQSLQIMSDANAEAKKLWDRKNAVADAVYLSRNLSSEPANILYPESFAQIVKKELTPLGIKVEVFDEKQLQKFGMGSFLGVGQGSVKPPRMVVLQYNGGAKSQTPIAIVGKGITFDTGGISIKPSAGMEDMKWDMAGAGVVTGLFAGLAKRNAKVNVVGVMALAENMPDGNAQRPGDVVTSMSGQTIEVLNTDAEGRLVLADALWYVQEKFKPEIIVDLATLTGAVIVALGHEYAGVMGNDDALVKKLIDAGDAVDEKLWHLPLCEAFDKQIDSKIADVQNISSGKGAGSSNGGQFLQRFIQEGQKWAHLDIAGVVWTDKDRAVAPVGATGFGVRLLDQFIARNYEK